jgi:hypothetical protein
MGMYCEAQVPGPGIMPKKGEDQGLWGWCGLDFLGPDDP